MFSLHRNLLPVQTLNAIISDSLRTIVAQKILNVMIVALSGDYQARWVSLVKSKKISLIFLKAISIQIYIRYCLHRCVPHARSLLCVVRAANLWNALNANTNSVGFVLVNSILNIITMSQCVLSESFQYMRQL